MTTRDAVMERVRRADPIADVGVEVASWSSSDDARRVFDQIVGTNVVALRPSRKRQVLWIGGAAVVTGALATATAASGILGEPAPDPIRASLAAVDQGLPDDLRLNPDVDNATSVASSAAGVLYAADVAGGGYCYEIASDGVVPRGAVCVKANAVGDRPIEITAPIPADDFAPLLVAGRINDGRIVGILARYPDGTTNDVGLGESGYWLFEVPESARGVALTDGFEIVGIDGNGLEVVAIAVPPLRDDNPNGANDRLQPIFVSTFSDESDLTLVVGIEGSVNVEGATTLELQYPDGTVTPITFAADGTFLIELPAERHADFAAAWGQVIARDASGAVIATDWFTSVANHQRETSPETTPAPTG